jgi:hypothetical protein
MGGAPQVAMCVASQIWQIIFASQTFQVFRLALRKKAQYVVVNLESSGIPATLELNCRGQNTLPLGVFYTVEKALKCICRKWPHMNHSDICSTSYGRKKGRESN